MSDDYHSGDMSFGLQVKTIKWLTAPSSGWEMNRLKAENVGRQNTMNTLTVNLVRYTHIV